MQKRTLVLETLFRTAAALLLCLMLSGCAPSLGSSGPPTRLTPTKETENDILRCYPLDSPECRFFASDGDILIQYPQNQGAVLLRYSGKNRLLSASFPLPGMDCSIQAEGDLICCYDPQSAEVWLLDKELEVRQTISLPGDVQGSPLLTGNTLYYSTRTGLMKLELDTEIHQLLRQWGSEAPIADGWMSNSGTLVCRQTSGSVFLDAGDGSLLSQSPQVVAGAAFGNRDYLAVNCGAQDCLYLKNLMLPLPLGGRLLAFLPELHSALAYVSGSLLLYDLNTGNQTGQLTLTNPTPPVQAGEIDGKIWFLQRDQGGSCLFQWSPDPQPIRGSRSRMTELYTAESPDEKGLAQCRQRAAIMEESYGLSVSLHTAAARFQPDGYQITPEHITATVRDGLEQAEKALSQFPTQLIRSAAQGTNHTYLCLVRQISSDSGESLPCLPCWNGRDCYLFVEVSEDMASSILRCLSFLLDSRILLQCDAYDSWDSLNPAGFCYGQGADDALIAGAFADSVPPISPAEDRADVLLAAMAEGNRELFLSAILQSKLRRICTAIRTAFPDLPADRSLLWEQYLWSPM